MRVDVGDATKKIGFVAVNSANSMVREDGKTTGWTIYWSLNGGTATAVSSPDSKVSELSAANMPGDYTFDLDVAGMVASKGELMIHFAHADCAHVTRVIEIKEKTEDEVWDADVVDHGTVGTLGKANAYTQATKEDIAEEVWNTDRDKLGAGWNAESMGALMDEDFDDEIADAVWDALKSEHTGAGSMAFAIGAPVALDSGEASLSGMLTKMADNNGGADFLSSTDSQAEIHDDLVTVFTAVGSNRTILLDTEVSSVTSTTEFILKAGSTSNDSYNGMLISVMDDSSNTDPQMHYVTDYVGSTKTVTVDSAPSFTVAADDPIKIYATLGNSSGGGGGGDATEAKQDTIISNLATVDTVVDAVKAKTDNLPADPASETNVNANETKIDALNDISSAEVNTQCDAALRDYDGPTKAEMDTALAALNDISAADVNTQCDSALADYDGPTKAEMDTALAGLNDISSAEVNTEVDNALVTYHLDHLFFADYDPASKPGSATALLNELIESDGGVSRFTTNALEQAPSGGASAADIADAVWDEAIAGHTTSTTFGGKNQKVVPSETINDYKADVSNLDATVSSRSSHSAADVWAVGTRALTDKAGFSISGTKTTLDALNDVSAADVNTQCDSAIETYRLHELMHTALVSQPTSGSLLGDLSEDDGGTQRFTENALEQAPSGTGASAATIADAVWDEALADHDTEDSVGNVLNDMVEENSGTYRYTSNALSQASGSGATAAEVWAYGTRALTDKAGFTISGTIQTLDALDTALDSAHGAGSWATATGFSTHAAADVWDVTTVGHATADTFGQQAKTDIDAILADTAELQTNQGNWLTATGFSTHSANDVTGGTTVAAAVTSINTNVDANETKIDTLTTNLATVDAIVDDILLDTAELQTNQGNWLTATGFSTLSAAEVNDEVDSAIETYHLDHLLAASYDPTSKPGHASSLMNILVENDGGVPRYTANALENAPSGSSITDWTNAEKEQIRDALGVDGTKTQTSGGTIDDILTDTNDLQTNQGDWATATGFAIPADAMNITTISQTAIKTKLTEAMEDLRLNQLFMTNVGTSHAGSVFGELCEQDGPVLRFTENALEEAPSSGSSHEVLDKLNSMISYPLSDHYEFNEEALNVVMGKNAGYYQVFLSLLEYGEDVSYLRFKNSAIERIMSYKNSYMDTRTYTSQSGNQYIQSSRLRTYDSAANATTHGAEGLINTTTDTFSYSSGLLSTWLRTQE